MQLFLDSLKSVQKLWKGKRKLLGEEQESPAKKSKVQATHMLNSHKSSQAGGDTLQGSVDPKAAGTTTGSQLDSHRMQQQQQTGLQQLPSSMPLVEPRQLMQHQRATAAPESYGGVSNSGYEQVQRTLARPPIATAQRQQAAQARSKIAQQRQVFQHLPGSQVSDLRIPAHGPFRIVMQFPVMMARRPVTGRCIIASSSTQVPTAYSWGRTPSVCCFAVVTECLRLVFHKSRLTWQCVRMDAAVMLNMNMALQVFFTEAAAV